jgi:hypothetical protein
MDIAAIKERARVARSISVLSGPRAYTLLLPTAHEMEIAVASRGEGEAGVVTFLRAQVERALIGWEGVTLADFDPAAGDSGAERVPFAAELVPELLDTLPEDAALLRDQLVARLAERRARVEAAAKN